MSLFILQRQCTKEHQYESLCCVNTTPSNPCWVSVVSILEKPSHLMRLDSPYISQCQCCSEYEQGCLCHVNTMNSNPIHHWPPNRLAVESMESIENILERPWLMTWLIFNFTMAVRPWVRMSVNTMDINPIHHWPLSNTTGQCPIHSTPHGWHTDQLWGRNNWGRCWLSMLHHHVVWRDVGNYR